MEVSHVTYQTDAEGLRTEYDICVPGDLQTSAYRTDAISAQGVDDLNHRMELFLREYEVTQAEIERLTNHADGLDYAIAVVGGILSAAVDSVFIGKLSLENAQTWGKDKIESFVKKIAQKQGFAGDENDLHGAVSFLEKKFNIPADKVYNSFGGALQHHLRDFSHHPTLVGLLFSLLTQFTKNVYGTDVAGNFIVVPLNEQGLTLIGNTVPEKIVLGVVTWFFHLVSDVAGSSGSILGGKYGTGLPGPFVSLLKEISSMPFFTKMNENEYREFSVWISKLFNGTLLGTRDSGGKIQAPLQFDLRTEIGQIPQLAKQTIPVIINECIVRAFFFIRRLKWEIQEHQVKKVRELKKIDIAKVVPAKNRTIIRMLSISFGTFTALDMADAAVRAVIESKGAVPAMLPCFILRVNFIGVGRTSIAIGSDVIMGISKGRLEVALTSGEIAFASAQTVYAIDSLEERRLQTAQKIERICEETEKLKKQKF